MDYGVSKRRGTKALNLRGQASGKGLESREAGCYVTTPPLPTERWAKALSLTMKEMCKTLGSFGSTATLNLLISVSNRDPIVNELLPFFSSIAAVAGFMSRISNSKVGR